MSDLENQPNPEPRDIQPAKEKIYSKKVEEDDEDEDKNFRGKDLF